MFDEREIKILEREGYRSTRGSTSFKKYMNFGFARLPREANKYNGKYFGAKWKGTNFSHYEFDTFAQMMDFVELDKLQKKV